MFHIKCACSANIHVYNVKNLIVNVYNLPHTIQKLIIQFSIVYLILKSSVGIAIQKKIKLYVIDLIIDSG